METSARESECICPRLAAGQLFRKWTQDGSLVFISLFLISQVVKDGEQKMQELQSFKRGVCLVASRELFVADVDFQPGMSGNLFPAIVQCVCY